ncbi:MAG: hypothetical protein LBQ34_07760 [Alphaproteobacteria bacterium]|jgi:hypothetical protein|nr:hypothetical protein [Alphaproteobacteria bacterium]
MSYSRKRNIGNKLFLEVLPQHQQHFWEDELAATPKYFTLYGSTALALQLGHREAEDFYFFTEEDFNPAKLYKAIPYLDNAEITKKDKNTLQCVVARSGRPIKVFFFGNIDFVNKIESPMIADNGVAVASKKDIAGTKMAVILDQFSSKDYLDIWALLQSGIKLPEMLRYAEEMYGDNFNPHASVKSLAKFRSVGGLPMYTYDSFVAAINDYNATLD